MLFGGAVVVGALLTAFFWPFSISHHASGLSMTTRGPGPGTCGYNCECFDAPGSPSHRKCVTLSADAPPCKTQGGPCRLPGDPPISASNPIQMGIDRLLKGQNVFTGDPILGGRTVDPLLVS